MGKTRVRIDVVAGALALGATGGGLPAASAATPDHQVLISGLDNPRQIVLRGNHELFVAETGAGGNDVCVPGPEGEACIGASSAVRRVEWHAKFRNVDSERVVTGLPSAAEGEGGSLAAGSGAIAERNGSIYSVTPYVPDELLPAGSPLAGRLGKLLVTTPGGTPTSVADVAAYERTKDPDHQGEDSNPYSLLSVGTSVLVADAGGND